LVEHMLDISSEYRRLRHDRPEAVANYLDC
jgi:hypothetical protein